MIKTPKKTVADTVCISVLSFVLQFVLLLLPERVVEFGNIVLMIMGSKEVWLFAVVVVVVVVVVV